MRGVFCPRCGAESEKGSRYCASCGASLPQSSGAGKDRKPDSASLGERVGGWVGRDRRTRLVTLATVAALIVAIVAFVALGAADEGSDVPQDAYTKNADAACVQHKKQIAAAQRIALNGNGPESVSRYADAIVPLAGEWRLELGRHPVPADRDTLVADLRAALLEVQIEAGALARVAREANPREIGEAAARVDAATGNVEDAVDALGLEDCAQLLVEQGQLVQR